MHLFGNYSYTEVERKFGTIIPTLKTWISSYRNNGIDELQESHTWRIYPLNLKTAAINDYLSRKLSLCRSVLRS